MKKILIGLVVLALVASNGYVIFRSVGIGSTPPEPTQILPEVRVSDQIVAEAEVVPAKSLELNFLISGVVAEVLVTEGDVVAKDTPLARLDTRDLELQVEQQQALLAQAKASYDKLLVGASPAERAIAHSQVAQAEAQLQQARGSVTSRDIAAAQAQVNQARAALARLEAGAKPSDIQVAQAARDQADANLQQQRAGLSATKTLAQSQMEQAAIALRNRQAEYSRIYWANRALKRRFENSSAEEKLVVQVILDEDAALRAVESAEENLRQARVAYEEARQAEIAGIAAAEAQVRSAESNLDKVVASPDADQLTAAQAQLTQAEANLAKLDGEQRAGSLNAAAAGLASAHANLDRVTAKPLVPDIASAEAQVRQAEIALKQAELALDKTTMKAPIAGTVAEVNLTVGEALGMSGAAIVLADLTAWQIKTIDLTELQIVHVHRKAPVMITFNAIPGLELPGRVTRIKTLGKNRQGDIVYTVVVTPDRSDERLYWNMTATVTIDPE